MHMHLFCNVIKIKGNQCYNLYAFIWLKLLISFNPSTYFEVSVQISAIVISVILLRHQINGKPYLLVLLQLSSCGMEDKFDGFNI
jgi:hypothetical protein